MKYRELFVEENNNIMERYELAIERITEIIKESGLTDNFSDYFTRVSEFILMIDKLYHRIETEDNHSSLDLLVGENHRLYEDILVDHYNRSYANPEYAKVMLGEDYGKWLCFLYTELRGCIIYAYESRLTDITIHLELFIQVYNIIEDQLSIKELEETIYYFESDYSDVMVDYRIRELLDPELDFATDIIMNSDLSDLSYLYRYGEYITQNELGTAKFLNSLSEDEIQKMASTYTEGFRVGFSVNAKVPLSSKSNINIRYSIGQERIIREAISQFREMGLEPIIYRAAVARINRKSSIRTGYIGTSANRQYEYDHRMDEGLFLDKAFIERKLEVLRNAYEERKDLAKAYAGPAVVETFGEKPFAPISKMEVVKLTEKQQELSVFYSSENGKVVNHYIPSEEYSFTIIAYPIPEIGDNYEEIYHEIVKVNTLDVEVYKRIQQFIIDALDQGVQVRIVGAGDNETDMIVDLHELEKPQQETNFENCLADVNIPVGEVFTSPKLKGTQGILYVSEVYLNELIFKQLKITFKEGMIVDYTCSNFDSEEENRQFIKENLLYNRDTLPLGEFAIGTNTTAYVMAHKYDLIYKLPILIAEKMGPHFAVGDTCYSHSEEVSLFNPDGKEIVAKENERSALRRVDESKAYFNCHTDITIPYEEIEYIAAIHKDGTQTKIIEKGRFVLPGTEELNKPFDHN